MRRDVIQRRRVVPAEWCFVQRRSGDANEIALIGGHDVLERRADRPVGARRGELELLRRELAAALDELLGRPVVVLHLSMQERIRHVYGSFGPRPVSIAYPHALTPGGSMLPAPRIDLIWARCSLP